ncbi:hypothetical protein ANRL4_04983 [Anaerolineae bacterium]|nr:hypothetical protein ANRL4_04983 [Anaerolineae bacterium]
MGKGVSSVKSLGRAFLIVGGLGAWLCVILLLNFTAPNPTGRRYSSRPVDLTASIAQKGRLGEDILSDDLRLPNNNDQGQCICGNSTPVDPRCNVCFVQIAISGSERSRRPDFVSDTLIADAKNVEALTMPRSSGDHTELRDYATAALKSNRSLWVYVRVNTAVDPIFYALTQSTGGNVVHYFVVPGWHDPVDDGAKRGLVVSLGLMGIGVLLSRTSGKQRAVIRSRPARTPPHPVEKALNSLDALEQHRQKSTDRAWEIIDRESARHDPPEA